MPHEKSVGTHTYSFAKVSYDAPVPKTVVIVDDHPSFRASARAVLEAEGFEVVGEAEDGASAIATARALKPDVLLLDVQLPDMDGFAVCDELNMNGSTPAVVLVSSRDAADYGGLILAERRARLHPKG